MQKMEVAHQFDGFVVLVSFTLLLWNQALYCHSSVPQAKSGQQASLFQPKGLMAWSFEASNLSM